MCLLFMARPLRIEYPGAFYHITTRGVGRQNIFFKDCDKKVFLEIMGDLEQIKTDKNFKKLVRQLESDVIASYNYNEYQTSKM